jgi:protease-4
MLIDGLSEKFGVTWDDVRVGGNATMWSNVHEFSPAEWARFQESLDRIYADFTGKVAQGRGLSRDSTHAVARGRIWTGADALELGLVDELGGLDVALALAKELAGLEAESSVTIRPYPRERSLIEMLLEPGPSSSQPTSLEAITTVGAIARVVANRARELGVTLTPRGVLTMPGTPNIR